MAILIQLHPSWAYAQRTAYPMEEILAHEDILLLFSQQQDFASVKMYCLYTMGFSQL